MDKPVWQMTLDEFVEKNNIKTRPRAWGETKGGERPIDRNLKQDMAYLRVQHKRAIRRALAEMGVDLGVLKSANQQLR